ncbi:phosphotransferase [Streptomyces pacificus]|uniref:Aminoglycoside phosphotransferase n=1 Tax=Streptomyces pacificus TaxID=2705029 RepID=A0A6A0AWY6_9ACTN|nr:phosphotransferase [Streptomyces pacificus]GFH36474.1 aminoglycoside phosphotransferase [Streptomyces pacificus]
MPRSSAIAPPSAPPPLAALLRRYEDTGEPLTCEPVTQGLLNRGYRLATTRGAYFLKQHVDEPTADRATIARQHRAVQRLQTLGVPVAPPVADRSGDTVAVIGGHCYALHPWVDGRHRRGAQLTTVESRRLGGLLGLVHTGLERVMDADRHADRDADRNTDRNTDTDAGGFAGTGTGTGRRTSTGTGGYANTSTSGHPGPAGIDTEGSGSRKHSGTLRPHESADPEETSALIDTLLVLARAHRPRDSFDALAEYRLLERRALLEGHAHRRPPAAAAGGWVHGDFHPLNLLYRGDHRGAEPAAIVDWDRLGVQPRAEEAVRAAAIFFVRPSGRLELGKVRAYARAYRRAAGADPAELAAAVHRVWWERLNDFWILRWRYQLHDRRADPQFPAVSALAVWWTQEYEAVCEAFAG